MKDNPKEEKWFQMGGNGSKEVEEEGCWRIIPQGFSSGGNWLSPTDFFLSCLIEFADSMKFMGEWAISNSNYIL